MKGSHILRARNLMVPITRQAGFEVKRGSSVSCINVISGIGSNTGKVLPRFFVGLFCVFLWVCCGGILLCGVCMLFVFSLVVTGV